MSDVKIYTSKDDPAATGADPSKTEDYVDVRVVQDGAAIGWELKNAATANKFRRDLLELLEKYGLD